MVESKGLGEKTDQACWKIMTRCEKFLLFLLIIALMALILLAAYVACIFMNAGNYCNSPDCIKASAKLLELMNMEKKPCENFESFVCGNYIPSSQNSKDDTSLRKQMLVNAPFESSDGVSLVSAKRFYQACVNTTVIEEQEINVISTIIVRMGGWPLLLQSKWKDNNFYWLKLMAEVRRWGIKNDWLINFDYFQDEDGINRLLIKPPDLKANKNQFKLLFCEETIIYLSTKLGSEVNIETSKIREILDFEKELTNISQKSRKKIAEHNDFTRIKVQDLNQIWPKINLAQFFNDLARGYSVITNSTLIAIASEKYLFDLQLLLSRTSNRVQANYFIWKTVENYLLFLSDEFRQIYEKYYDIVPREEYCFSETTKRFYSTIETSYMTKYKEQETISSLELMAKLVTNHSNVNIISIEGEHFGFTIQLSSNNIVKMVNEIQFNADNEYFKCLHKKSDCQRESYYDNDDNPYESEAYFNTEEKTVYLPYSLVHSEFYTWDQPNFINYARMGRTIGDVYIEALRREDNSSMVDAIGLDLAYKAYLDWSKNQGQEAKLPALNYSTHQLFWIHSSSIYCSSDEEHSAKFQEVANSDYFKAVFRCE